MFTVLLMHLVPETRSFRSSEKVVALAHLGERQTEVYFGRLQTVRYLEVLCSIHRSDNSFAMLTQLFASLMFGPLSVVRRRFFVPSALPRFFCLAACPVTPGTTGCIFMPLVFLLSAESSLPQPVCTIEHVIGHNCTASCPILGAEGAAIVLRFKHFG
ncbi:hypothetical protein BST61_g3863 [Cercospora zeina]